MDPWRRSFSLNPPGDLSWLPVSWPALIAIGVILVVVFFTSAAAWKRKGAEGKRLPPGPRPWPILGSLPLLGPLVHQDFQRLAKQYGPIFLLRLGSQNTVVIASPRLAEEVLKKHDSAFASRPTHLSQFKLLMSNNGTIASAPYGSLWRFSRKVLTLQLLTNKRLQLFERVRKDEIVGGLISVVEDCKSGQAIQLHHYLSHISMNIVTRMTMSKTFGGHSPSSTTSLLGQSAEAEEVVKEMLALMAAVNLGDYVTLLKPFDLQGYKKRMREVARRMDTLLQKIIDDRREYWKRCYSQPEQLVDPNEEAMNFVDALLTLPPSGVDRKPLTDTEIKAIIKDVIIGGGDTSTLTVEWAMTELLKQPALLKKAQDELDSVVGRDRLVEEADLPNLTFHRCIVKEAFRLHPVAPNLLPHECIEAREIGGYYIPAKAQVFVSAYCIHRDPNVWERPLEFYPERFLSTDIDVHGQNFELLPFGAGRRNCPGKSLGLVVVDYMLALFLQGCNWALPPGVRPEDVDLDEGVGSTCPKKNPLQVIASPRLPTDVIHGAG